MPTLNAFEELERKGISALDKIVQAVECGKYTHREAYAAAIAVWDCLSGLVPTETTELITEAIEEFKETQYARTIYFKGVKALELERLPDKVRMRNISDTSKERIFCESEDTKELNDIYSQAQTQLEQKGWQELWQC